MYQLVCLLADLASLSPHKCHVKHQASAVIGKVWTDPIVRLQNLDTQLQRTLNMDDFDTAQAVRDRRKQIDELVAKQLVCALAFMLSEERKFTISITQ